jgi:hypothetical protein
MTSTAQANRSKSRRRKAAPRAGEKSPRSPQPKSRIEKFFYFVFLCLPVVTLIQSVRARADAPIVAASIPGHTVLAGPHWTYAVPFAVQNKAEIEKLIQCESSGANVSLPDSDGITSDGILQFHRGPSDTMADGTWEDFSRASGIGGSPKKPADAIRMTDWALSHGLGPHWTCWRRERSFLP